MHHLNAATQTFVHVAPFFLFLGFFLVEAMCSRLVSSPISEAKSMSESNV
jgi:hypothetical protein